MEPVSLYYRTGDVGDGDRWEAVGAGMDGAGSTASKALVALGHKLDAAHQPEPDESSSTQHAS